MTRKTLAFALVLAFLATAAFAAPTVRLHATPDSISFTSDFTHGTATLSINGPDGYDARYEFAADETPSFFSYDELGDLADGSYGWELLLVSPVSDQAREALRRSREAGDDRAPAKLGVRSQIFSGHFLVAGGTLVVPEVDGAEEAGSPVAEAGPADAYGESRAPNKAQVFATDLIVQGSACVGVDCTSGESFGFDTIRLKENNLRIKFDDTSSSGSFPNNDWQLVANDTNNGGANRFSVEDVTHSKTPFTIEANAPNNTLYVDSNQRVGVGTSSPAVDLHLRQGNSPALRLEQDGSSGFTAQTWDLAGNEANFFLRDVTHSSKLPFRVEPGAPDNALYVDSTGFVGIGKQNPTVAMEMSNSGDDVKWQMGNTTNGAEWFFQVEKDSTNAFYFSQAGTGGIEMELNQRLDGNVEGAPTLEVFGSIRATNVTFTSSRDAKTDFAAVDPHDVLERLAAIPVQTWRYKTENGAIRHMGPIAEDFAAAFDLGNSEKHITVTDINGVALAAIQALHKEVQELKAQNAALAERLEETP